MLKKIVVGAEDLVAPLEHIFFDKHFIDSIFDHEAQIVRLILLALILLTVDQLGCVGEPSPWNALDMSVPGNWLPVLLEIEGAWSSSIVLCPIRWNRSFEIEARSCWNIKWLKADEAIGNFEFIINVKVLFNYLFIVKANNFIRVIINVLAKSLDFLIESVDLIN